MKTLLTIFILTALVPLQSQANDEKCTALSKLYCAAFELELSDAYANQTLTEARSKGCLLSPYKSNCEKDDGGTNDVEIN